MGEGAAGEREGVCAICRDEGGRRGEGGSQSRVASELREVGAVVVLYTDGLSLVCVRARHWKMVMLPVMIRDRCTRFAAELESKGGV